MTIPRPDPMNAIEPVDLGNFQVEYVLDINKGLLGSNILRRRSIKKFKFIFLFKVEMTCLYKGGKDAACPKHVYRAKTAFQNAAIRHGERLTQYYNTPSCDKDSKFWGR